MFNTSIYCMSCTFVIVVCFFETVKCDEDYNSFSGLIQSIKNLFPNFNVFWKNISETIIAAIDEECVFKCPSGNYPKTKFNHQPEVNGCGVPGLQIPSYIPIWKLEKCCNEHDICYGTCNKEKEKCDKYFKNCLYNICSSLQRLLHEDVNKGCKGVAKILYTAVTAMGCKYYLNAQKDACICSENYYSRYQNDDF